MTSAAGATAKTTILEAVLLHQKVTRRQAIDIATLPYAVVKKMVRHPLTDLGLKQFLDDWAKAQKPLKATP